MASTSYQRYNIFIYAVISTLHIYMISTELHKTMAYQDSGDSDTPLLIMANKQVHTL